MASKFVKKCRTVLQPDVLLEFRTETFKLLIYNYFIVFLIANKELNWFYPFKDVEMANRLGLELMNPILLQKFGFYFRAINIVVNSLGWMVVFAPAAKNKNYLLPVVLWNIYIIVAISENIFEIIWTMLLLEVPTRVLVTIFIVGAFVIGLHSKLTLQTLRYYEYLNFIQQ